MKILLEYVKQYRKTAVFVLLALLTFWLLFFLYRLPIQAAEYGTLLVIFWGGLIFVPDYLDFRKKHRILKEFLDREADEIKFLPKAAGMIEKDYQKLLAAEKQRTADIEDSMNRKYTDMLDYYSMWVHQIKTPIASMRLALQEDDSDSTDYVFREYSLDSMIRQAVRKFSSSFIQKKIRLHYEGTQAAVVTDEKWLLFVIEQVLSNGLKYTRQQGCITIEVKEPQLLCIRDTGIGIAPEDLPRIFDKGYTGYNGRTDKKASGIGLYLCRRICGNLGHKIWASSSVGEGTVVYIDLRRTELHVE